MKTLPLLLIVVACLAAAVAGCEKHDCRDCGDCPDAVSVPGDDTTGETDDDATDDATDDSDDTTDDTADDVTDDTADDTGDDDTFPELPWIKIPEGTFEMGCSPGDPDCNPDEQPAHTVEISSFSITRTEITQAQFEAVLFYQPSHFTPPNGFDACPTCPVEDVSWIEAKQFCVAAGGRLPTEAEWEYAARAGATTRYTCGDDWSCLDGVAWYYENSGDITHPVGSKDANAFGLFDTLGNVWEWVNDWYNSEYYLWSPLCDPPGAEEGSDRVLRGGAWKYDWDWTMTLSDRTLHEPDAKYSYLGFRCAKD